MELFKTLFYWFIVGSKKRMPIKLIAIALLGGGSWNLNSIWNNNSFSFSMDNSGGVLSIAIGITGLIILLYQIAEDSKKRAIIIQHTGIAEIPTMDIDSVRPIWDKVFRPMTLNIECERFYKNGIITDPESALEKTKSIQESIENNTRKISPENLKLYYAGLVQVPFAFLAGVIFDNTKPVEIYDWNRKKEKWHAIKTSNAPLIEINIEYPEEENIREMAIEIAISYNINRPNTLGAVGDIPILRIESKPIEINNTDNLKSQKYIANELHKILDKYNYLDKIHIFVAAQNSMVFNLGRQISKRVHPKILVWQYEKMNKLKNPWAIEISDLVTIKHNKQKINRVSIT